MMEPLEQAKHYLLTREPHHIIDQVNELTWNLTELPTGAKHWHMVIGRKDAMFEDIKGYHVFWYNGKVAAYCKNVHFIDFEEVREKLMG